MAVKYVLCQIAQIATVDEQFAVLTPSWPNNMEMPAFFKACEVPTPKARNVLKDRSLSALDSGEIGIKITATAINPVDWKMRDYDAFITKYPAVLGSDAAGVVAAVGSNVSNFEIGDRVFFQGIIGTYDSSTFQQFCKMPAVLVSKTPDNMSDEQAAGVSLATMAIVTAFYSQDGHGMIPPWEPGGRTVGQGKAIAIIGGASSVGQYAIQMAKLSGYDKIVTNASADNHAHLKSLGAHIVLDRSASSAEDFATATSSHPLDFVFDAISVSSTQKLGVEILQHSNVHNSHVITLHTVHPADVNPDAKALGQSKEPKVDIKQVLGIGSSPKLRYLSEPLAKALSGEDGYIAQGLFSPNRPHLVSGGLHSLEDALALNKQGVSGKKVVLRPCDT